MKRILIIIISVLAPLFPVFSQTGEKELKREVTLYNPYKPTLTEVKKKSFLPDLSDTSRIRPDFIYNINTIPYSPDYSISPIKAASLLPDPLHKLYKSYIKLGLGNYYSPLAELSITNERSKKGALGFYARHFSSNGKVKLQNDKKVFAGYMDNDLSLFGKKFFRRNLLEGSLDFNQKSRYAYGYDTSIVNYSPEKKDILFGYNNLGANISFASLNLDSSSFSYDFDVHYDFFYNAPDLFQHNTGVSGLMSKNYKGFYAGSSLELEFFNTSGSVYGKTKYITSVSPFISKSNQRWNFKLGLQLLLDRNMTTSPEFHLYPDVNFGFSIVPSYMSFFTGLNGKLEVNEPEKIIEENPFLVPDGSLFTLPNTNHSMIVSAGFKGNNGIGGNYLVSASYSMINDLLFYSNIIFPDMLFNPLKGNMFIPVPDDAELLKVHGEMTGLITDKISYSGNANWYNYTLSENEYPWTKPEWDAILGVKYNLRNKIIAGVDVTALGTRRLMATKMDIFQPESHIITDTPVHLNFNLSAEYRYTKILSFWLKFNNIAFNRYYEWAYYPSQRFLCMAGLTYSL